MRVSHSFDEYGDISIKFQIVMTLTINITIFLDATIRIGHYNMYWTLQHVLDATTCILVEY